MVSPLNLGMHRLPEDIKSHIQIVTVDIQRLLFGTHRQEGEVGHLKLMKKWEEARGFIRVGTRELRGILVEDRIHGLQERKWRIF